VSDEVTAPPEGTRTEASRPGGGGTGGGSGGNGPGGTGPTGSTPGDTAVSRLPAQLYAARMRARARWRRLSVTITVTLLILAIVAYMIVWHTSVFAVTTVRVAGAKTVATQRITAAASIGIGTPLVSVDTSGAVARVEKLPQIASAQVSLDWPHTVVVSVVERVPAALVPDAGRYDVVDVSGVVFGTMTAPGGGLPVIRVQGAAAVKAAVVPGALAALKALPADIVRQVSGISASSAYSITLALRGGAVVDWGSGEQSETKAADLAAMMRLRKADRYDVSAPDAPAMS